jgi:hypothetical protein
MSEKRISRRGAFSLLGLAAAVGFGVPTTMLTMSDAEAQAQPTAPAPSAPAPTAPATPDMQQVKNSKPVRRSFMRRGATLAQNIVKHGTPLA